MKKLQEQISRMHEIMGVIVEQKKLNPSKFVPKNIDSIVINKNEEILSKLPKTIKQQVPPTNDRNFLVKVLDVMDKSGFQPYLNVNTNELGQPLNVNPAVTITIPKTNVTFDLQDGYFGTDILLPKDINLSAWYNTYGDEGGGWKDTYSSNITNPNTKVGVKLTIPIGGNL